MKKLWKKEHGQAMVEWALVFPMFLVLVCTIIDFGWMGYQQLLFESAYQVAAWDFPLIALNTAGNPISDLGIIDETNHETLKTPYSSTYPDRVVVLGTALADKYPLGEGIKQYMLRSAPNLLNEDKLEIINASAVYTTVDVEETYPKNNAPGDVYYNKQLRVALDADIEYTIEPLTPIAKNILANGNIKVKKKLIRNRTERVIIQRRGEKPIVTP